MKCWYRSTYENNFANWRNLWEDRFDEILRGRCLLACIQDVAHNTCVWKEIKYDSYSFYIVCATMYNWLIFFATSALAFDAHKVLATRDRRMWTGLSSESVFHRHIALPDQKRVQKCPKKGPKSCWRWERAQCRGEKTGGTNRLWGHCKSSKNSKWSYQTWRRKDFESVNFNVINIMLFFLVRKFSQFSFAAVACFHKNRM